MTLTRLVPSPGESWDQGDTEFRDALARLYALESDGSTDVRINMVQSLNGSAVGEDGTSETLSNRTDRAILGAIRSSADAIVVGAETVRREGYLAPKRSTLAVVTASGDLTGHRLHDAPRSPVVVRPASAADRVTRELDGIPHVAVTLPDGELDARAVVNALRERGLRHLVCEGGPRLTAAFLSAGVVDELCLTLAPRLDAPGMPIVPSLHGPVRTTLRQLLIDETGMLFTRWGVDSARQPTG